MKCGTKTDHVSSSTRYKRSEGKNVLWKDLTEGSSVTLPLVCDEGVGMYSGHDGCGVDGEVLVPRTDSRVRSRVRRTGVGDESE